MDGNLTKDEIVLIRKEGIQLSINYGKLITKEITKKNRDKPKHIAYIFTETSMHILYMAISSFAKIYNVDSDILVDSVIDELKSKRGYIKKLTK